MNEQNQNQSALILSALTVAKEAARKGGARARELRESGEFSISFKGNRDLVTEADLQCEEIIIQVIREAFPEHNILSEEGELPPLSSLHKGPLWIIDPIDGTTNFAHGQPCVGVSVGFAIDGRRQAGAVYCPFLDEMFSAARGHGAYLNDKRISVSTVTTPEEALVCTGFPYQREYLEGVMHRLGRVLSQFRDLRRLGACSVDLCFTACGRLDGFYEDVKPWDVAAGLMIAEEAGAFIGRFEDPRPEYRAWRDPNGETPPDIDGTNIIVCSPGIAEALQQALKPSGH
ncbi:MAG: inositol monophosphatase [Bdellovibrionales bacterium]|nr:inositol monophosphatase [Bdellovibrionales bacterium]